MQEIITVLSSDVSILSAIPVSYLQETKVDQSLSSFENEEDYKLLVSEPNRDINTKHISKFVTFNSVANRVGKILSVDDILDRIKELDDYKSDNRQKELNDSGAEIYCNIEYPYIISSITETLNGNICSINGYDLSDGIETCFDNVKFNQLSVLCADFDNIDILANGVKQDIVQFINSSVSHAAANYVTKNINGDAFSTLNELTQQTKNKTLYYGGELYSPQKDDYCVVLSDESKYDEGLSVVYSTRYSWNDKKRGWEFRYVINTSPYTSIQWNTINSGVTKQWKASQENFNTVIRGDVNNISGDVKQINDRQEVWTFVVEKEDGTTSSVNKVVYCYNR